MVSHTIPVHLTCLATPLGRIKSGISNLQWCNCTNFSLCYLIWICIETKPQRSSRKYLIYAPKLFLCATGRNPDHREWEVPYQPRGDPVHQRPGIGRSREIRVHSQEHLWVHFQYHAADSHWYKKSFALVILILHSQFTWLAFHPLHLLLKFVLF